MLKPDKSIILLFITGIIPLLSCGQDVGTARIWDKANHNAFTDLIRFKSYFYCTFREGKSHVPKDTADNGKIRIIRSHDGKTWESVVLLSSRKYDLRDPKLSVTPGHRLMVLMGGSHYVNGILKDMLPHISFSSDGLEFSDPEPASIEDSIRSDFDWIWRVTWRGNKGYGVVYQSGKQDKQNKERLLMTPDGISYSRVADFNIGSLPNEATVRFDGEGNIFILLRREANANGFLGMSPPPYTDWKWKELTYRLGGPDLLVLKNNRLIIGTRLYLPGSAKTVIYCTNRDGNIRKSIELPSGGDTSYPGLLIFKRQLYISYYSSHEGKTSIYLSRISMKDIE